MGLSPSYDDLRRGSFEEFVHATGPRMHRTALLLCGDHHLAEDLTQSAYAKIFASWRRVRATDNPVAYARTVLTRTWLSHRRLRRTSERPTDTLVDRPDPDHDPHEVDVPARMDLIEALSRLRPDDRVVLVLRFYEDLSVARTAALLDLTEAATRKRCERALERLRQLLPDLIDVEDH